MMNKESPSLSQERHLDALKSAEDHVERLSGGRVVRFLFAGWRSISGVDREIRAIPRANSAGDDEKGIQSGAIAANAGSTEFVLERRSSKESARRLNLIRIRGEERMAMWIRTAERLTAPIALSGE